MYFAGRVQGVGFRYTACRVSERFDATGFVRNLADGRVELVAEGDPGTVEAFVEAVKSAMREQIDATEELDGDPSGEFAGFGIRQ